MGRLIKKHRSSPQKALIKDLGSVIRGWTSYYKNSDASSIGELARQDHLTYLRLRRWAKRRCEKINSGHKKYWVTQNDNNWVFATNEGKANSLRLLTHKEFGSSSTEYVKVKGDKSPNVSKKVLVLLQILTMHQWCICSTFIGLFKLVSIWRLINEQVPRSPATIQVIGSWWGGCRLTRR